MKLSEQQIQSVWARGEAVGRFNPEKWRKDVCGAWICRDQYANRASSFGWEIDHVKPVEEGGADQLANLRPLQWKNLSCKRDGKTTCPVTANGGLNLDFS